MQNYPLFGRFLQKVKNNPPKAIGWCIAIALLSWLFYIFASYGEDFRSGFARGWSLSETVPERSGTVKKLVQKSDSRAASVPEIPACGS